MTVRTNDLSLPGMARNRSVLQSCVHVAFFSLAIQTRLQECMLLLPCCVAGVLLSTLAQLASANQSMFLRISGCFTPLKIGCMSGYVSLYRTASEMDQSHSCVEQNTCPTFEPNHEQAFDVIVNVTRSTDYRGLLCISSNLQYISPLQLLLGDRSQYINTSDRRRRVTFTRRVSHGKR